MGEAAEGTDPGDLLPLVTAAPDTAVALQEDAQNQQVRWWALRQGVVVKMGGKDSISGDVPLYVLIFFFICQL